MSSQVVTANIPKRPFLGAPHAIGSRPYRRMQRIGRKSAAMVARHIREGSLRENADCKMLVCSDGFV